MVMVGTAHQSCYRNTLVEIKTRPIKFISVVTVQTLDYKLLSIPPHYYYIASNQGGYSDWMPLDRV